MAIKQLRFDHDHNSTDAIQNINTRDQHQHEDEDEEHKNRDDNKGFLGPEHNKSSQDNKLILPKIVNFNQSSGAVDQCHHHNTDEDLNGNLVKKWSDKYEK